jgi:hypothetical protein
MRKLLLRTIMSLAAVSTATLADAAAPRPDRVDIQYVAPKSAEHRPLFDLLKQRRVLERIRDLLEPLRLPKRLLLKTEGCDGVSNAWYEDRSVTVCYEYLDGLWKNVPKETTQAGLEPIDTLIGPVMDVFLHEVGHAVIDMLSIPVLGREEDAADVFSAYIMLRFNKDEARRLILGNAYQYKQDLQGAWAGQKFADEHGTPAQRFYNVLCLAYGADDKLFHDVVDKGFLPKNRAEGCGAEYLQAAYALDRLVRPHIDRRIARRLHRNWLPPVTTHPPYHQRLTPAATPQ